MRPGLKSVHVLRNVK